MIRLHNATRPQDDRHWPVLATSLADAGGRLAPDTLAVVQYGPVADADPRRLHVPMPMLLGGSRAEVWQAGPVLETGHDQGVAYARTERLLFAHLHVDTAGDSVRAAEDAYWRLEAVAARQGFPYWLRTWNFLHRMNEGEGDQENYRQFCIGRARALASRPDFEHYLPAATAIGMDVPGLIVALIASASPGQPIENPRQVAAYRYPRQYGPRSPSFTRAMLLREGANARLLVSGTASVVGHATRHAGNVVAQLEETRANLDALLRHAAVTNFPDVGEPLWAPEMMKLYLRHEDDLPAMEQHFPALFGAGTPWIALRGDICRRDLLLEVEGVFRWVGND